MKTEKPLREVMQDVVAELPENCSTQLISTGGVQILIVGETVGEVVGIKQSVMNSLDSAAMSRHGRRKW